MESTSSVITGDNSQNKCTDLVEVPTKTGPSSTRSQSSVLSTISKKELAPFKTPDPPPAKKKRIVLEENKYAEELEKIVQRDFFPDLEKLKAQNAYLSAMENNDIHMLRELYSKYSLGKKTPRCHTGSVIDTPSTFETPLEDGKATPNVEGTPTHLPMETPRDLSDTASVTSKSSSKSSSKNMTLNKYLDTYTSEDNQSFQDIMEESERKHRIKHAWLYDTEDEHNERQKMSLALPSIEQQAAEYNRPLNIDTWTYRSQNYIMYVPDGVPFTAEEEVEMAKKRPEVVLNNTRFQENPFKNTMTAADGSTKNTVFKVPEGKIGLDGKEVESDTPKVNGFSIVKTPSPTPGVEDSPFMTWGEIEGTPFRLDGADTPVPVAQTKSFHMLNTSKRERLAIELAEKVSQRYRDKKAKAIETARHHLSTPSPRPKSSMDRLMTMSPAVQKFAKSHLTSRMSSDVALRESYTPKRIATPAGLKTPSLCGTPSLLGTPSKTPVFPLKGLTTTSTSSSSQKKDNFSSQNHNPSRPRAADFI